jgi:PKD repeat protein
MRLYLLAGLLLLSFSVAGQNFRSQPAFSNTFQFIENKGQWNADVLFRAGIPGGYLLLKEKSLQYVFYDTDALREMHLPTAIKKIPVAVSDNKIASFSPQQPLGKIIDGHSIVVHFEGAAPLQLPKGIDIAETQYNYFYGNTNAINVGGYNEVIYKNLYPGISLRFYTKQNTLKYEFIVEPKADASAIKLRYEGADAMSLESYNLLVKTSVNILVETRPYVYQMPDGKEKQILADFKLDNNLLTFRFPKGYNHQQALVIDPTLVFSTYSGSFADNWGFTATYDSTGNLYSGGIVLDNLQFPVSSGAFQRNFGGAIDVGILKYSADGKKLLYATYLGGSQTDIPHSLIVDKNQHLLLLGTTSSSNFPVSASAFDKTFNGGVPVDGSDDNASLSGIDYLSGSDAFIAKLSENGNQLLASTYLGGSGNDGLNASSELGFKNYGDQFRGEIALDSSGNIYIASSTTSVDFPMINATQAVKQTRQDGFIAKLDANLSTLIWSTFLGGNGHDAIYGMKVDAAGKIFVCGATRSSNLPASPTALKTTNSSNTDDGFVAVYENNLLKNLTYLGTGSNDQAFLLDLDEKENIYVLGLTFGSYPVTAGKYRNGTSGQFIHAMKNTLDSTLFTTTIGTNKSSPDFSPTAFLVNECGNIYLAGWGGQINRNFGGNMSGSTTTGLSVTSDAYRSTTVGDDFYFMVLETQAKSLLYATFFGENGSGRGNHVDGGTCRFDKKGIIYHTACACKNGGVNNFPTSSGAYSQKHNASNCNAVGFKFDLEPLKADFNMLNSQGTVIEQACLPIDIRFANASTNAERYEWVIDTVKRSSSRDETYTFTKPGQYKVTLRVFNKFTCKFSEKTRILTINEATFTASPNAKICRNDSLQLFATGGDKYTWAPATGLSNPTIANPKASPDKTTEYTVKIVNNNGCETTKTVKIEVEDLKTDFELLVATDCDASRKVEFNNKTPEGNNVTYLWNMGNGDIFTDRNPSAYFYPKSGHYTVVLTASNGACVLTKKIDIIVENPFLPPNMITPNGADADGVERNENFEIKDSVSLNETDWQLEVYNRWGKQVYRSKNYQNEWGKEMPVGTYFYIIRTPGGRRCKGWLYVVK